MDVYSHNPISLFLSIDFFFFFFFRTELAFRIWDCRFMGEMKRNILPLQLTIKWKNIIPTIESVDSALSLLRVEGKLSHYILTWRVVLPKGVNLTQQIFKCQRYVKLHPYSNPCSQLKNRVGMKVTVKEENGPLIEPIYTVLYNKISVP